MGFSYVFKAHLDKSESNLPRELSEVLVSDNHSKVLQRVGKEASRFQLVTDISRKLPKLLEVAESGYVPTDSSYSL